MQLGLKRWHICFGIKEITLRQDVVYLKDPWYDDNIVVRL